MTGSENIYNREKPTYCPSTSSSLKWRYSDTLNCSTLSSKILTRTYSQTPGLGRTAMATNGGRTIASYDKNQPSKSMNKFHMQILIQQTINNNDNNKHIQTPTYKFKMGCIIFQKRKSITWADLRISPKGPVERCSLPSSSPIVFSSSSIKWWGCKIPFPWSTYLKHPQQKHQQLTYFHCTALEEIER